MFVRGSVIRYVHVPPEAVATDLLQDAARREAAEAAKAAAGGKKP
jgi:U6 snRNA-associated Sm-like protein LSm2